MQNCSNANDDFLFKEHTIIHGKIAYAYEHTVNGNKMCLTGICDGNLTLDATSAPMNGRKCRFRKIHERKP